VDFGAHGLTTSYGILQRLKMMVGRLLDKVKSTEHWNVFVTDSHSQDSLSFFLAGPYGKGVEFLEVGLETAV
jgi:hypothetical protein